MGGRTLKAQGPPSHSKVDMPVSRKLKSKAATHINWLQVWCARLTGLWAAPQDHLGFTGRAGAPFPARCDPMHANRNLGQAAGKATTNDSWCRRAGSNVE